MRYPLMALCALLGTVGSARAQVGVGVELQRPGISIGVSVPVFPDLVLIPGYPVYYDPRGDSNYFFYDGLYWVYQGDQWYESSWYDGPWQGVGPEDVPLFVLRVPVRYYRRPPPYFAGWRAGAPPRWGEHWGKGWEEHRRGWDEWDHRSRPPVAPLPAYQRQYAGDRYPREREQQAAIRSRDHHDRPREPVTRARVAAQGDPGRGSAGRQQGPAKPPPGRARDATARPGQPASHQQGARQAAGPRQDGSGGRKPEPRDDGRDRKDEHGREQR
jgi:hypothetical protein